MERNGKKRRKMTAYRSRRKRSSFPKQKRTASRLSGLRREERQENMPQNPSRNSLREPSALQSSDRIRFDRKTDRIRIYSADRRVRCRQEGTESRFFSGQGFCSGGNSGLLLFSTKPSGDRESDRKKDQPVYHPTICDAVGGSRKDGYDTVGEAEK